MALFSKKRKKSSSRNKPPTLTEERSIIGPKLNFAASEAYKILRTNLMFSLADQKSCHVIGVTSALKSEGKSTTSLNTAYTIAENGKRVLLLEADMRLPTLSKRVGCDRSPGLSNVLADQCELQRAIQRSEIHENLYYLTAGDIPPNPSELLDSENMGFLINFCRQNFDMVIVDLTPATIVADATIAGKMCDGVVIAVAEDYCSKRELNYAVNQLQLAGVKILGFVMTRGNPGRKSYYKRYYKGYYRNYYKKSSYYKNGYRGYYGSSAYKETRERAAKKT